jgi:hypothetical protein
MKQENPSRVFPVLALLAAAAACSGAGGGSGPVAFEDYCSEYAAVTCSAADKCGCLVTYSVDLCRTYMGMECRDEVEEPVERGVMAYDASLGGACLGGLRALLGDCSLEGDDYPEACERMLTGIVPEGGLCGDSDECSGDLECTSDLCTHMPGPGEACADMACASDTYCGDDQVCHPYKGLGEDCSDASWTCDDDLVCDTRTYTCRPYLGPGESCSHDPYACDDDLYCSPSSQTCRPYPGSGQDCADSGGECADGLYCDAGNLCRPQKDGGEACIEDRECLSWECVDDFCGTDEWGNCPFL